MKRFWILAITVLVPTHALALEPEPDAVFVHVVDVGAGLCCVVNMPGGHHMIYDAGNYTDGGTRAFEAVSELIPEGEEIDLMVLSHSDADHLGAVDEICDAYAVKKVIRSGMQGSTGTWNSADQAVRLEKDQTEGFIDINLRYFEYPPGATYRFGETFVTMVCGFHEPLPDWDIQNNSERRNAGTAQCRAACRRCHSGDGRPWRSGCTLAQVSVLVADGLSAAAVGGERRRLWSQGCGCVG